MDPQNDVPTAVQRQKHTGADACAVLVEWGSVCHLTGTVS